MTGQKFDSGKAPLVQGCFHYFPDALIAVALVSQYGAEKYKVPYADKNWAKLDNAQGRYSDSDGRHLLGPTIEGPYDSESKLLHAAHHAWNALACLQLLLKSGVTLQKPEHKDDGLKLNAPNPINLACGIPEGGKQEELHVILDKAFKKRMAVDADGGVGEKRATSNRGGHY